MNIITLQSDYPALSLSSLSAPVKVIEVLIPNIQVVEGMEGVLAEEPESIEAALVTEEIFEATVMSEEVPIADLEDEEPMEGVAVTEESMEGIWEDSK